MPRVALLVAYDGTALYGFQRQREGLASVQGWLEEALSQVEGRKVVVTGAGRTDAGVHALQQVVHADLSTRVPPERLPLAVKPYLPPEIVVAGAVEVPEAFHARFAAVEKTYRYFLWRGEYPSPFWRRWSWHRPGPLDFAAMSRAAAFFEGEHDFTAFQASGSTVRSTVRRVSRARWRRSGPLWAFEVTANGFLYRMVRGMVGTLAEVGRGMLPPDAVAELLQSGDRRRTGPTAPAAGLFLVQVRYDLPALERLQQGIFLDTFALFG